MTTITIKSARVTRLVTSTTIVATRRLKKLMTTTLMTTKALQLSSTPRQSGLLIHEANLDVNEHNHEVDSDALFKDNRDKTNTLSATTMKTSKFAKRMMYMNNWKTVRLKKRLYLVKRWRRWKWLQHFQIEEQWRLHRINRDRRKTCKRIEVYTSSSGKRRRLQRSQQQIYWTK